MLLITSLLLLACGDKDDDTGTTTDPGTTPTVAAGPCADLGYEERAFDPTEPATYQRWQPAGDFTVPLRDGSDWTLSEQWTGCDSYVFLPHWWPISAQDDDSWWTTGVEELLERSPKNVHYFFVVGGRDEDDAEAFGSEIQDDIDATLADLDEDEAAWWIDRLHVVAEPSDDVGGLVEEMFDGDIGMFGFAIDREQRIRTLGYMPAVEAYSSSLNSAGEWPWELRLYSAAHEPIYFNFEAEREAGLDPTDTIIEVFGGDVYEEYEDGTLSLPDADTMAGFDTLLIDVLMECPDKDAQEISNCGAWDYLAHMWLYDDATKTWLEMGRFITTYHRESRWIVDGSHALAWLQEGGDRTVRYSWAPSWNTQPTGITLKVRLGNHGKGSAPRQATALFQGGSFSSTYNDDRPPVDVEIPADAVKVELVSIATGHGMDTYNCAEFCEHGHHFTIGDTTWDQLFEVAGTEAGCADEVGTGTVPNQAGTWWYGRGGWCPGRRVDPFVVDVTAQVTPGETATVSYEATIRGSAPIDGTGDAELYSWLVVHR